MAQRTGYPTSDVDSNNAFPDSGSGGLYDKVDDDGAGDYFYIVGSDGYATVGYNSFGGLPPADGVLEVSFWLYWHSVGGSSPPTVTISLLEGIVTVQDSTFTPSTSNSEYILIVPVTSLSSVTDLRTKVYRNSAPVLGNINVTGMRIRMEGASFAHLALENGMIISKNGLGSISMSGGMMVKESHAERGGESLILDSGMIRVSNP